MSDYKTPTLFLGHGSPLNALENNDFTKKLIQLGVQLGKPKAIVMISAHWETEGSFVTAMEHPELIYDFYGFPKELYQVQYKAKGNPNLAQEISEITGNIIKSEQRNWGLDHGSWTLLKFLYPLADIPVVQISIDRKKSLMQHFELGKLLKVLREKDVLLIGSGNIVHNLKVLDWKQDSEPFDWAIEFDENIKNAIKAQEYDKKITELVTSRAGQLSVPTLEHFIPLLYVLGASEINDKVHFDIETIEHRSISMRSVRFE